MAARQRKPKLGQNFLVDDRARYLIADALGPVHDRTVIEIGPGHGAITDILARRCRTLIAIELDPTLAASLTLRYSNQPNVRVVHADVLATDFATLLSPGEAADVIGNLPYYITSDILLHLFAAGARGLVRQSVVMMQREVADRVAASPGTRDYGMLSATAAMNCTVEHLLTLPPAAFRPPPEVYSSVLRLRTHIRYAELGVEPAAFTRFLRASFAQKRKTLANNLRAAGYSAGVLAGAWPPGLAQDIRAEAVPIETAAALCRNLARSPTEPT